MARKPSSEQGTSRDFRFTGAPSAGTNASSKFRVPDEMLSKWQRVVDLMERIAGVPAGLIIKARCRTVSAPVPFLFLRMKKVP